MKHILLILLIVSAGCRHPIQSDDSQFSPDIINGIQEFQNNYGSRSANEYAISRKLIPLIQQDMTQEEVRTILGKPEEIQNLNEGESWMYSLFWSMRVDIQFDKTGRVLQIFDPFSAET